MTFIDEYLTRVVQPGHGYGSGCTITRRSTKVIEGVEFTRVTLEDNFNGERESVYLTEDGFVISPMTGSYGEGTKWGTDPGMSRQASRAIQAYLDGHSAIFGFENLTQAAQFVTKVRDFMKEN